MKEQGEGGSVRARAALDRVEHNAINSGVRTPEPPRVDADGNLVRPIEDILAENFMVVTSLAIDAGISDSSTYPTDRISGHDLFVSQERDYEGYSDNLD